MRKEERNIEILLIITSSVEMSKKNEAIVETVIEYFKYLRGEDEDHGDDELLFVTATLWCRQCHIKMWFEVEHGINLLKDLKCFKIGKRSTELNLHPHFLRRRCRNAPNDDFHLVPKVYAGHAISWLLRKYEWVNVVFEDHIYSVILMQYCAKLKEQSRKER